MSGDRESEELHKLFAIARSFDHVIQELPKKVKPPSPKFLDNNTYEVLGFAWESSPLPENALYVVKLSTREHKRPPLYFRSKCMKIIWEHAPGPDTGEKDIRVPSFDLLLSEEESLADDLRSRCDPFGKERDDAISETGDIILEMGKLYLKRALACKDLEQVLRYIIRNSLVADIRDQYEKLEKGGDPELVYRQVANYAGVAISSDPRYMAIILGENITLACSDHSPPDNVKDVTEIAAENYLKYSTETYGLKQRLGLIKAAGLVIGANIRYQERHDKKRQAIAKSVYEGIVNSLLKASGIAGKKETDISQVVDKLQNMLNEFRSKSDDDLDGIVVVQEEDSGDLQLEKEQKRIQQVRRLCESHTRSFIHLMSTVSKECQKLLRKPPCRFAIVGLGSLARKEVTLFSDFEHVIVLENSATESKQWLDIQEYFRWFTALFHLIVIGLEETVIPSLDIKCLYEKGTSRCWFSDEVTPNGVSFDGMMPHACKIPVGRTERTKYKTHTVELIQTAKNMASFLTRDEDVKNGYFPKEVLSCTCFVDGDDKIYESFLHECRAVRDREVPDDLATRLAKYIILNPTDTVSGIHVEFFARQESIKRLTYRPLTTQLAYLARLCGIECESSFGILDAMKELKVVDDETYHNIAYALAVAIEGGLKAYADTGHQRRAIVPVEWSEFVGSKGWIDCQVVIDILGNMTRIMPPTRCFKVVLPARTSDHWNKCRCLHMPTIALFRKGATESLRVVINTLEQYTTGKMDAFVADFALKLLFGNLRHCFLRMYLQYFEDIPGAEMLVFRREHPSNYANELSYCEWACQKMLQVTPMDGLDVAAYQSLCVIRFNQKRYKEGLEYFDKWNRLFSGSEHEKNFVDMWIYEMIMRREVMGNEQALEFIEQKLSENTIIERRCVMMISRCQIWLKTGRQLEAEKELLRIADDIKNNSQEMSKYSYEYLLRFLKEVAIEHKFKAMTEIATKLLSAVLEAGFTQDLRMVPDTIREKERNLLSDPVEKPSPQEVGIGAMSSKTESCGSGESLTA